MVITFTPLPPVSWSGSGTEADPFLITNSTDLEALRNFVSYGNNYNGYWFKQTQPIDLSGVSNWTPIGNSSNKFGGNYDGDNNPITGLTISDSNDTYCGLFGYVSNDEIIQGNQAHCQLKNIIINGCNISGSGTIGGIVGHGTYIDFTNCQITGNITTTGQVGGIIGYMDKGSITNCFTSATVVDTESDNGSYRQGLFVGELANSSISFSSSDNYYRTTQSGINPVGVYSGASASGTFNAAPVYSVTCPTGLATTGTATVIHDESRYYAASATATVAVTDPSQAILTLNATSGSISNVVIANDKHSATFTMGSGDVTLTATYLTVVGTCGNNGQVTWSLGGTNYTELTIDGTGAMDDFSCDSNGKTTAPWGYNITSVNVGNGVTRIGNYAFSGCQQLATVSLGSGLTTIGNYAFSGCQQLATVSLPNSVTSIGEYAFSGCQQLATINLGNGLTSIGNNAFANCAMTEITLPSNVATLNAGLFANCASLQRVNFLHNGAITLGSGVFSGCNSLQYLVFPSPTNALTHIQTTGNWASYQAKIRARFGNQHFTATNEGGTAAYAITNESDLRNLATAVNAGNNGSGQTFRQTADITLNGSFTPIGNYTTSNSNRKFSGTYDGGNNTISGLTISGNYLYAGLFGYVDIDGMVKNVRLVNPSVTSSFSEARVAALIGGANRCTVQNCLVVNPTVSATASSNNNEVGALIGSLSNATVQNCFVISPTVSGAGTNQVGAICGYAYNSGSTYHCTLTNVYYYNSSLGAIGSNDNGSFASLTNVGRVRKVTLGSGMANVSPEATNMANGFVYDNESYYREGLTLTLTDNLGTTSEGYTKHYYANGTDLNGTTYTVSSTDGDVTFTADCRSDGQQHEVTYVNAQGESHTTNAIPLDGTMTTLNGTYYVGANITFTSTITLNGNTNIILANGKTMNVGTSDNRIPDEGIKGNKNRKHTLTIYGQSLEATAGHLSIYNNDEGINLDSYNQQSGNVTVNSTTSYYTISCNSFTLSGGKLNAINNHTNGLGITGDQIRILGGQLDTYVSNNGYALTTLTGSITLGWTNATDHIYASRYDNCTINIASGQVFVTNDPTPDTITGNNIDISRINGKILRPVLTGHGTTDDPYLITNAGGWDLFCDLVQNSIHTFQGNVKLCADISVSRMAGSESKPFCGNFDGQEYTITFNYNTSDNYVAPFRYVTGGISNVNNHATISNLNVVSTINGSTHLAGLIANQKGIVDLTNCHVTATIVSTATTDSYCAGLVSHAAMRDSNNQTGYGNAYDGTLTISGCTVSGLISTYGKYAGGFVGMAEGKTSIVNSLSGVTIESFVSGNGTHGGFIGLQQNTMNYTSVKTTIEGCLFNGKLITSNGTTNCGGFIGWHNGGSLDIKYCLYAPADLNSNETAVIDGSTFVGNGTVGFNCIYSRALGTAQGKATHNITAGDEYVTISNIALISLTNPDVYNVSGITSYDYGGISCGDDLYICEDAYVSLVLSNDYTPAASPGSVYGYTASGGTLEYKSNGTYTLTMPDADVTINVDPTQTITLEWSGNGTESNPYIIYSKDQLDLVASRMYQHGYNYGSDQDYEGHPDGYFFKLGADIVYPYTSSTENNFTPIGNSYPYPSFQGTFDGDGHTISGIRINANSLNSNGYYFGNFGLFGEIAGTIKNVTLADACITGSSNLGGIVGNNYGTLENNLVIGATISATNDNSHGIICGYNYGTLERNYYVGCTVGGVENATGVGCGYIYDDDEGDYITADITENDGAMPGNARTVEGYNGGDGGWVFISSPVTGSIAPNTVANIFSATDYDLYRFNQDAEKEWQNWKVGDGHNAASGFSFVNGQGYLYATKETKTLVFSGEFNNASSQEVSLAYNADAEFAGWNLVGNPLIVAANITDNEGNNKPFYVISGRNVVANTGSTIIEPCTGVMVKANGTGESVTFRRATASSSALQPNQLQMTLAQQVVNRGGVSSTTVDNAIVSFNEGNLLEKFVFNADLAKLYIPQGGKDFAIVTSEGQGEIPVNFKAMENGTYTITVNPEGVEMGYLHLIDNMTGADVDLLAASCTDGACTVSTAPSYTFTARTTDYESRFKLVFVCGDADDDDDTFAFFSNGSFVISNEGRATLQVIDVNGRIISSEQINGSVSKAIHAAPGVYMIRLVNGDDVKVQKVVVR